jgi:hypothetical protein
MRAFSTLLLSLILLAHSGDAQAQRSPEELREFREKVTKERVGSQRLLKTHKLLKEQGRLDEAAKVMEEIVARKQRLNEEIAGEAGLGDTYLKYRKTTEQKKKHPFANTKADGKSRIEWETERNMEMKSVIAKKCQAMTRKASVEEESAPWLSKISEYQRLQIEMIDQQLEVSKSFEAVREISDPAQRKSFLEEQKKRRIERRPQESAMQQRIDALHKELLTKFDGMLDGATPERFVPDL